MQVAATQVAKRFKLLSLACYKQISAGHNAASQAAARLQVTEWILSKNQPLIDT